MSSIYQPWLSNPGWGNTATVAKKKKTGVSSVPGSSPGYNPEAPAALGPASYSTPDFYQLSLNDPLYQQFTKDMSAQSVADAASRDAAWQRYITQYGYTPDLQQAAKTLGFNGDALVRAISPQILETAKNNPFSVRKRIEDEFAKNQIAIRKYLRQSGAVRSGESGYQYQQGQKQFDTSNYDANQQLLDYLSGANQSYVQSERQRQMALAQAQLDALLRQMQLNQGGGSRGGASPAPSGGGVNSTGAGDDYRLERPGATTSSGSDPTAATWAQLNAKYSGQIASSGADASGRPYVILTDGRKVYS